MTLPVAKKTGHMEVSREKLKQIRKSKRLTQHQFADMLEISREMVNKMEKGHVAISPKTVFRLMDEYGYKLEDMLAGSGIVSEEDTVYQKGIPVFNIPLTATFLKKLDEGQQSMPISYLDKHLFPGCSFAALAPTDPTMKDFVTGDYLVCQPVTEFDMTDPGSIYFISTNNGTEQCGYLHPYPEDETKWLLHSDDKNIEPLPLFKDDIQQLHRVKGVIRKL
jgi:transcriptional regulator with XRE-family HTH domain